MGPVLGTRLTSQRCVVTVMSEFCVRVALHEVNFMSGRDRARQRFLFLFKTGRH